MHRAAPVFLLLWALCGWVHAEETSAPANDFGSRAVLGWLEVIRLEPWGLKMRARLDTGAKTSSMSARGLSFFDRDGKRWVRFTFDFKADKGKDDRAIEIERPVIRTVRIKRHNNQTQERPVVGMEVCLNDQVRNFEFSLIDRRGLNYPILLGREALKDIALVDPAASFRTKADCGHNKKKKSGTDSTTTNP